MKKFLKKFSSMLTAVLMIIAVSVAPVMNVQAFDNNVKSGTVAVAFYVKNGAYYAKVGSKLQLYESFGDGIFKTGSGFFVGKTGEKPQYIVTNHHVVADYISANQGGKYQVSEGESSDGYSIYFIADSCEMRIYYSQDEYDVAYVDCYGDMNNVDLAVLRLKDSTDKRHPLKIMEPTEAMVGTTVYTVGYPGNADNEFTGASKYGVDDATVHKGVINKIVVNEGKGVERLAVDATIQHGNSGGPLVNEEGYVLGVNTNVESNVKYQTQVEADYYAISSAEVVRFLDKNNIPYEMASSGNNTLMIILIAAGVVVIGVIAAVVVKNKKKKAGVAPAGGSHFVGGKGVPVGAAVQKGGLIRSASAQHGGKTFPVGKAPVMIGRDAANCVIVFKEGTPGVSGKHCTVSYDSSTQEFTLTDLKSSFGTFLLSSGKKLNANEPVKLRAGESFYVGDKANVLSVELEK